MSLKIFCSILVGSLLYFTVHITAQNNKEAQTTLKNINDTILEFFNNCTCIPYYLCSEANKYVFAARANILPQDLFCTSKEFFCCKNSTDVEPEEPVTTATEASDVTEITTETTLRHVDRVGKLGCGIAKTDIAVRILTTDTESATTIPGELPWMVEIFQKKQDSNNPYKFKCAGSLIHPQVVLTATHCIVSNKERQLKIVATGREIFQNVGIDPQDERNVKKIIKHPEYYSGGLYNDVALLILENAYNFSNNFLNSVCLPASNQSFSGKKCLAVGWGTNVNLESIPLRKVDVPIIDPEECQNLLRKTRLGNGFQLHSSFTCAGGEEGKDTCKGDGGSPLICLGDQYEFVQAGIVSWGVNTEKCGLAGQPGLYADVTKFRNWIDNQLTKNKITLS